MGVNLDRWAGVVVDSSLNVMVVARGNPLIVVCRSGVASPGSRRRWSYRCARTGRRAVCGSGAGITPRLER